MTARDSVRPSGCPVSKTHRTGRTGSDPPMSEVRTASEPDKPDKPVTLSARQGRGKDAPCNAIRPSAAPTLTAEERARLRSKAAMCLCNLAEFRLFWIPSHRCLLARSLITRNRPTYVPEGAIELGVYAHGAAAAPQIIDDLEELLVERGLS